MSLGQGSKGGSRSTLYDVVVLVINDLVRDIMPWLLLFLPVLLHYSNSNADTNTNVSVLIAIDDIVYNVDQSILLF